MILPPFPLCTRNEVSYPHDFQLPDTGGVTALKLRAGSSIKQSVDKTNGTGTLSAGIAFKAKSSV